MKKWIHMLLAVVLAAALCPIQVQAAPTQPAVSPMDHDEAPVASGSCGAEGSSVTWTLDHSGLLTISGTGAMKDDVVSVWSDYIDLITRIIIEPGVTTIGDHAFVDCYNMSDVTIPGSVTSIGREAFYACESLSTVNIPEGVTFIGEDAFAECYSLTSVTIPVSVSVISDGAFHSCYFLENVYYSGTEAQWAEIEIGAWNDAFSYATIHYEHSPEPAAAWGDANGDGQINSLDAVILRQYLAGWDVSVDASGSDANGDGQTNALDAVLLRQHLAGWDVTLGPAEP